ncbi:hypothetical protein BDR04DRAFT_1163303 [Suillus decipiens]|nr:hypothetical protein BDR04DRAFT_1163303 [Suillus decipiens]
MKNIALTYFGKNSKIFDDILNYISDYPIFQNQSNNPQLPVSIQLAIFLNWAGHYGNAITLEDVAQWAGVSVGSMVNCTNHVMIVVLDAHDQFVCFPADNSEDADWLTNLLSHAPAQSRKVAF